jgi:Rieske Fe-S protein
MTRREYLNASVVTLFSTIIAACTKKVGMLPLTKKLVMLSVVPAKAIANDQLKVFWNSENIKLLSVHTRAVAGNWDLIAENIDAKLGEYIIILPTSFPSSAALSVKISGDELEAVKTGIPTQNAFIIETSVHPELVTIGAMKNLNMNGNDVFVKRESATSIKCFSSSCTHSGCPISFLQTSNKFNCSCHGSEFDANGAVLQGPASTPLGTFICETLAAEKFRILY